VERAIDMLLCEAEKATDWMSDVNYGLNLVADFPFEILPAEEDPVNFSGNFQLVASIEDVPEVLAAAAQLEIWQSQGFGIASLAALGSGGICMILVDRDDKAARVKDRTPGG